MKPEQSDPVDFLRGLFDRAIAAAAPEHCLPLHLPTPPQGRTLLVAIGKAAASMARAAEQHWPKDALLSGFALTRYGHACECKRIEVVEAAHPVPDDEGNKTAKRIVDAVAGLTAEDLLLFLVSGGGSALLVLPVDGVTLDEKKRINHQLLMSGAPIGQMNTVRKHLSAVKGGRLAQLAYPAKVVTLAISDVPGDDPSTIASGPTVADPSNSSDALKLLDQYKIELSGTADSYLRSPLSETPKNDNPAFANTTFSIVAKPADMVASVCESLNGSGLRVRSLGANVEGEAHEVAAGHARMVLESADDIDLLLSGGETTVTVAAGTSPGRGGRNCEYLLALALELNGAPGIFAIAADTDGIDGSESNAGAVITPDTLARGIAMGLDPQDYLSRHDSYSFFEAIGDLVVTGPTLTNVNDFRAIFVSREKTS